MASEGCSGFLEAVTGGEIERVRAGNQLRADLSLRDASAFSQKPLALSLAPEQGAQRWTNSLDGVSENAVYDPASAKSIKKQQICE